MPDCYGIDDGDKDAIEDANEVWELAMQKHKRPTLYFGLKTSFLEELIFFFLIISIGEKSHNCKFCEIF